MKASRKSFNDHRPATESKQAFFPDDRNTSQNNDVVDFSEVKVLENLKIKIGGAKSLSSGGKDARYCYCSVQLDSEEIYKTRIVERSLRPFFQEEFVFDIPRNFRFLCFHFHDLQDDYISKRDSCIARVKLRKSDLVEFNGVERWHSLVPANARDQVQGQLFVEIKFDQCYNLSPSGFNDNSHKLSVRIPHCQGLFVASGNCDPYLSVTLQGIHRSDTKKSRPKKGTANPSFGEEFSFELNKTNSLRRSWFDLTMGSGEGKSLEEKWDLQILKIVVYNAGTLGDAFLGEVKIPLHNISRLHSGWHLLTSRSDKSNPSSSSKDDLGLLRIKINYTKDLIFPSDVYKQLLDNLLQSSLKSDLSASWPALIGAICGIKKQPIVAQHLVHIFLHQSSLLNLILPLADFEISSTGNLQMIFRNSSFTSFIIHESLLVIGQSYLHKVLLRAVERIVAEGRSCEIDPARLKLSNGSSLPRSFEGVSPNSQDMLHNNKEQLWTYVELILYSIIESAPDCPELLCGLFNDLRACAIKHFPDDVNVKYRVVTNFLFLRFFSAALLCPRKYKLISVELNATTNRTFTLLSKSIQLLCNLTLPKPSTKNPADSFCKIFLEEYVKSKHLEKLKSFIDVISASPGSSSRVNQPVEKVTLKEGLPTSVRLNIDQDRDLERLYVALSTSQDHIRSLQEECGARSVYVGPDPKSDDFVDSEAENTDDGENSLLQENNTSQKALPLPLDALDPQQTYRTLCLILDCVQTLDRTHALYKEYATNNCDELGSKNRPYEGLS